MASQSDTRYIRTGGSGDGVSLSISIPGIMRAWFKRRLAKFLHEDTLDDAFSSNVRFESPDLMLA
uniref:Uncharacterized protein n=1 Tax=Hyaloperonospora arabidopsidis (strain Emoy2) TaxID=559515 RepID=M4BX71_HYAAE